VRINLAIATLLSSVLLSAAQTPTVFKNLSVTGTLALPSASVTASMLASGAAKANLSTMLPGLSASVEGTGTAGLDGGRWFIYDNSFLNNGQPSLRVDRRDTSGTGGTHRVNNSLWATSFTNPINASSQWTLLGEAFNTSNTSGTTYVASNGTVHRNIPTQTSATASASGNGTTATVTFTPGANTLATIPVGHTVLIEGMAPSGYNGRFKVTASSSGSVSFASSTTGAQTVAGTITDITTVASWGMNGNCIESTGETDPAWGCLGAEFDVTLEGSIPTTDAYKNRVGVQIQFNGPASTSGSHAGRALLLGTMPGLTWDTGMEFSGSYGTGIDFTPGTFTGNAITLPASGVIGAVDDITLAVASGGVQHFKNGTVDIWQINGNSLSGDFVPVADIARNIGEPTQRVKSLWAQSLGSSAVPVTNAYMSSVTTGSIGPTSGSLTVAAGSAGNLNLSGGSSGISLQVNGTSYWKVDGSTFALRPLGDGSANIGAAATEVGTIFTQNMQLKAYTVATLPSCASVSAGMIAYVTDASSPTYNATLTGGSSTKTLAMCNGTNWTAH
jgi:hypothetical protein